MSGTYPTFPGLKPTVIRRPIFNTTIQRSKSLKELRASWTGTPLYEFELEYEMLRQGTQQSVVYTELATLMNFFETQRGQFDTFNYTDPYDGTVRQCRFAVDSLEPQRLPQGAIHWELKKVKLVTVK